MFTNNHHWSQLMRQINVIPLKNPLTLCAARTQSVSGFFSFSLPRRRMWMRPRITTATLTLAATSQQTGRSMPPSPSLPATRFSKRYSRRWTISSGPSLTGPSVRTPRLELGERTSNTPPFSTRSEMATPMRQSTGWLRISVGHATTQRKECSGRPSNKFLIQIKMHPRWNALRPDLKNRMLKRLRRRNT